MYAGPAKQAAGNVQLVENVLGVVGDQRQVVRVAFGVACPASVQNDVT